MKFSKNNSKAEKRVGDLEVILGLLIFDAERVLNKFGSDDDGTPSDYSEWLDLKASIERAKTKI